MDAFDACNSPTYAVFLHQGHDLRTEPDVDAKLKISAS